MVTLHDVRSVLNTVYSYNCKLKWITKSSFLKSGSVLIGKSNDCEYIEYISHISKIFNNGIKYWKLVHELIFIPEGSFYQKLSP